MDSFNSHDIRVEKANAISRYRRIRRITTLFRLVELFVFLIMLSRVSTQFAFSFRMPTEYFRGISVAPIGPRFVFIVGNLIVIVLFLISGQFSGGKGEKSGDFYEEYVKKCRNINQQTCIKEEKKASEACKSRVCYNEKKIISRSNSENLERAVSVEEHRHDLRRSISEKCRKSVDCGRKAAVGGGGSPYSEDEMSSEEFRRKVEAFIARQQKFLREEEEFSAVVSCET